MASKPAKLTKRQILLISKALADPRRFEILNQIAQHSEKGPMPCGILVETHNVSAATISHHCKELASAGLVKAWREGKKGFLLIEREILHAYSRYLLSI